MTGSEPGSASMEGLHPSSEQLTAGYILDLEKFF